MAAKHRRRDIGPARRFLTSLIESEAGRADRLRMLIETAGERGYSFSDIQARTAWRREVIEDALKECVDRQHIVNAEGRYISRSSFENLRSKTLAEIELQHRREPLAKGILRSTLKEKIFSGLSPSIFKALMSSLERKHEIVSVDDSVKLAQHTLSLSPEESAVKERLGAIYTNSGLEVPKLNDALEEATKGTRISRDAARKIFQLFLNSGELVKVSDEFYFNAAVLDDLRGKIQEFAEESGDRLVDVPKFKDIAGISRKYAIPLLEYFDRMKVTRREGDKRFIL
jgi:selenocysteine-specific elongation factor